MSLWIMSNDTEIICYAASRLKDHWRPLSGFQNWVMGTLHLQTKISKLL